MKQRKQKSPPDTHKNINAPRERAKKSKLEEMLFLMPRDFLRVALFLARRISRLKIHQSTHSVAAHRRALLDASAIYFRRSYYLLNHLQGDDDNDQTKHFFCINSASESKAA